MSNQDLNPYNPDFISKPGETLKDILEERGMSQADLAERMGRPKKTINEIIKGKAGITVETAMQFERVLGTPASFWMNRELKYREWLVKQQSRIALNEYLPWMRKFPIQAMVKLGWIDGFSDPIEQLEALLRFFGVASPVQWQTMLQGTRWRQSPTFAADPAAVSAWLRQGEILSSRMKVDTFDEKKFREALIEARKLTIQPPDVFMDELIKLSSKSGVSVIFLPEIPGTRTCGATRWLSPTKALIMLSVRYKTDDQLWFTFFHEAAHILLHGKREVFIEDDNDVSDDIKEKEKEANQFASDILIPQSELSHFHPTAIHYSHQDVISFAQRIGIAPGIIVGRLQHDGLIPQTNLNGLKRRFHWEIDNDGN